MIITKETQEKIVGDYLKNNSAEKTQGFVDGINAAIELIKKNSDCTFRNRGTFGNRSMFFNLDDENTDLQIGDKYFS